MTKSNLSVSERLRLIIKMKEEFIVGELKELIADLDSAPRAAFIQPIDPLGTGRHYPYGQHDITCKAT